MRMVESWKAWEYLKEWEIEYLTAEACGIGLRARIDVGPKGQELLDEYFGGIELTYRGWNNWEWKTMMMDFNLSMGLTVYGLLKSWWIVVEVLKNDLGISHHWRAYTKEEWESEEVQGLFKRWREYGVDWRVYMKSGTAWDGMMNRHEFTGRVL